MASNDGSSGAGGLAVIATWVHQHFLWLLVGSYVVAWLMPGPGLAIRRLSFTRSSGDDVTAPLMLLALLLFCAAAVVRWSQVRDLMQRPQWPTLSALADDIGVATNVVWNWNRSSRGIPAKYWGRFLKKAEARGIPLTPLDLILLHDIDRPDDYPDLERPIVDSEALSGV